MAAATEPCRVCVPGMLLARRDGVRLMHPILQQIWDLLETAPLTLTGKQDIRNTIRVEQYLHEVAPPEQPRQSRVRLAQPFDYDCDQCPVTHKHATNSGIINCIECGCIQSPREPITRRIDLTVD